MNLLLIDDHSIVLEALSALIKRGLPSADVFTLSDADLLAPLLEKDPRFDAILVDLNFKGELRGLDLIELIKTESPTTPVIVLSMHSEPAIVTQALERGANAYVSKSGAPSEILSALENVTGSKPATKELLSKREREIAELVVEGQSSREIAEKLFISVRTVEQHRNHILKKLGARNTAQLVVLLKS